MSWKICTCIFILGIFCGCENTSVLLPEEPDDDPTALIDTTINHTIAGGGAADIYLILANPTPTTYADNELTISTTIAGRSAFVPVQPVVPKTPKPSFNQSGRARVHHNLETIDPDDVPIGNNARSLTPDAPVFYSVNDSAIFNDDRGDPMALSTLRKIVSDDGGSGWSVYIWVTDTSFGTSSNQIDQGEVDLLADKFLKNGSSNDIFDFTTDIIGLPWGSHPYLSLISSGTKDIHILVCDIGNDGNSGTVVGYFYSRDNFKTSSISASNEKLMFVIDAPWLDYSPPATYSTVAHEFQHMIHFYQKQVQRNTNNTEVWLNEMLSQMIEDTVSPQIGLGDDILKSRIDGHLSQTWESLTLWDYTYEDYQTSAAFGAYLLRLHGGYPLINTIVGNSYTGQSAVTAATSQSWEDLLTDWGLKTLEGSYQSISSGDFPLDAIDTSGLYYFPANTTVTLPKPGSFTVLYLGSYAGVNTFMINHYSGLVPQIVEK